MTDIFRKYGQISGNYSVYRLLGLNLITNFNFDIDLSAIQQDSDTRKNEASVIFLCHDQPPIPSGEQTGKLAFTGSAETRNGVYKINLIEFDTYDLLRFEGRADYYLGKDRIDCYADPAINRSLVQELLFGTVLSFYLERQGIPVLHAAAIATKAGVAAFPSFSGDGKTTLAAAFLRAGVDMLSDDILPLEEVSGQFFGRPGIPQLNLWPKQQAFFLGETSFLENETPPTRKKRVPILNTGFGAFSNEARPLARFYLPRRYDPGQEKPEIKILPVNPAEAVMELTRFSFTPNIIESLGWQPRRMKFLARLISQAPVRRLIYPNGFEHLPAIVDAVLQDLEKKPGD
jgi:hypothetical protein